MKKRNFIAIILIAFLCVGWTYTFDRSTPTGADDPKQGDDRIREIKASVQERENVDHYWPLSGDTVDDANAGKHRKITFQGEQSSDPSNVANTGFLYTKDDGGDTELYYEDDGGSVSQLTQDGGLYNTVNKTGDEAVAGVKTFASFPVTPVSYPTTDYQVSNKIYTDYSVTTHSTASNPHSTAKYTIGYDAQYRIEGFGGVSNASGQVSITFNNTYSTNTYAFPMQYTSSPQYHWRVVSINTTSAVFQLYDDAGASQTVSGVICRGVIMGY